MSGNNMENLLLGDDSSSGDESDSDQAKKPPVAAAPAPPMAQQRSVQVPPQQQQPTMQRPPQQQQQHPPQQQMRPPQPMQHQQQARQPPQQQQSQKPSEMTMRLSQMYAPASANVSNNNNQAISSNMAGSAFSSTHPGMQQQQASSQQHRPVAARGGIPHQAVISVTSTPAQGSQSNRGPPNMQAGSSKDPYAPTPVSQIIERSKHKQQQQQQQGRRPQQPPYAYGNGSNNTSATSSSSAATLSTSNVHAGPAAASNTGAGGASGLPLSSSSSAAPPPAGTAERIAFDREMKKQKEKFIMFTRVLMKYLETKDPTLHQTVKTIIKDCAERNKRQERGYESVTASMKHRLRQVVGDQYWKRAEAYLNHFLKEKEKKADGSGGSSTSNSSSRGPNGQGPSGQGPSGGGMMPPQQQQQMMNPNGSGSQQQPHLIPPSSSSRPNSSQAPPSMAAMRQDMEQRKMALAAAGNSSTAKPQQQGVNKYPPTSSGGPKSSSNVPHQQASQPFAFNKSKPAGGATAKSPLPTSSSMNNQSRKVAGSPGVKKAASTTNPLPTTETQQSSAPREYNEFMQMVDNAVNFDWTTAGLMTGERLMFAPPQWMSDELQPSPVKTTKALTMSDIGASFIVPGWAHSNVVSSRTAWARVRLPELTRRDGPVLPGLSALPAMTAVTSPETNSWYNEDVAEDDAVLAAISEGCQIYLKQILEKAIYCSRQRQNLDGIRLYYNQCTKKEPQPLSLRLGCDVRRQWARTSGNAALVCKRMEEALERQEHVPHSARVLNQETLCHVESMSTLALRAKLANGAEDADREAKRCFEVYGGKDAREVFGRVPKQPKLELIDFQLD
ncbi:hypothetical protein MPSEU_000159100 [Mayamaea pseudoterrestris]|nr:hypothetical protein MPSEU_000159100 [Mayamaea pseudoterrestris]